MRSAMSDDGFGRTRITRSVPEAAMLHRPAIHGTGRAATGDAKRSISSGETYSSASGRLESVMSSTL